MSLAYPPGLLGLLALPVILALHLLRVRRQRYEVSSLSLWAFLEEEVRGSAPRRVPVTWLLLLDLLIAALLSLAWARPQITRSVAIQPARQVIVLMDVSTSMNARDGQPTRLESARRDALALLDTLRGGDSAALIAFGEGAHLLADTRQTPAGELRQGLLDLRAVHPASNVEEALASARGLITPGLPAEIHLFSDAAYDEPETSGLPLVWHRYGAPGENQAVLSIAASRVAPGQVEVFARFANFGLRPANREAVLLVDGVLYDRAGVSMEPNTATTRLWQISGQPQVIGVQLQGEDLLQEDDLGVTVLANERTVRVALVASQPAPLDRALRSIPGVRLVILSPDDYQAGLGYDLIIFRAFLPQSWPEGVTLVIEPPENHPLLPVAGQVELARGDLIQSGLLSRLDVNGLAWSRASRLVELPAGFTSLIRSGDTPVLLHGQTQTGQVFALLAPLAEGNFARHPGFPVLVAMMVEQARGGSFPAQLSSGAALELPVGRFIQVRITPPQGEALAWGMDYPHLWAVNGGPGAYRVETTGQDGEKQTAWFGVNAGTAAESNLHPRVWTQELPEASSTASALENQPVSLAPYLLGAAAILLLLEAWLAWR